MQNLQSALYTRFDVDPAPIGEFLAWLVSHYHLPAKINLLDVGIGPGRMLDEYAQRGWSVIAFEPDADFYAAAQQHAATLRDVIVRHGGFEDIQEVAQFDLITAINNPFSYLIEVPQRVDALHRMYHALRPGGVMFLDVTNFIYKLWRFTRYDVQKKRWRNRQVKHVMEHDVDVHNALWIHHDSYEVKDGETIEGKTHPQAIIPAPELLYFIEQAGFEKIETYNRYTSRQNEKLTGKQMLIAARHP